MFVGILAIKFMFKSPKQTHYLFFMQIYEVLWNKLNYIRDRVEYFVIVFFTETHLDV
jgi:hypothetical protein